MPYNYRVSRTALRRIQEAATFLEEQRAGHALEFDQELQKCIHQLCEFPESAPPLYSNRRRFYLHVSNIMSSTPIHHDRQRDYHPYGCSP